MDWLNELRRAVAALGSGEPLVAAMANTDAQGSPTIRSVVCRRIGDDGGVRVASDGRSRKNNALRRDSRAAVCFWFPGTREQFRLHGKVNVVSAADAADARLDVWRSLSDETRATFYWPAPDVPATKDKSLFTRVIDVEAAVPDSFELLVLHPTVVDHLDLNPHPHRRRQWVKADGWVSEELNP